MVTSQICSLLIRDILQKGNEGKKTTFCACERIQYFMSNDTYITQPCLLVLDPRRLEA